MKGLPLHCRCAKARCSTASYAEIASHKVVRTGRTRANRSRSSNRLDMPHVHEYRCSCGHIGWSAHPDVFRWPVEAAGQ